MNSTAFLLGALSFLVVYYFIKNRELNKTTTIKAVTDDDVKNQLFNLIENARGKYITAKNEIDNIVITFATEGKVISKISVNKINYILKVKDATLQLSEEEYTKLYNLIYFYII